jgi:hypothetical protein
MGFVADSRRRLADSRRNLSTSKGRQGLGICLSIAFIVITVIIVSSVWSSQWKSRVPSDLPSVLTMSDGGGGITAATGPSPTPGPMTTSMSTPTTTANGGLTGPSPTNALNPIVDTTVGCNGLASLCQVPVNQVLFATVHNAASVLGVIQFPNHDRNMLEALQYGYRGLNVDIGLCDGSFRLLHGNCALGSAPLEDGLRNITNFVQTNDNQVVLIPIQLDFETGGEFLIQALQDYIAATVPEFLNLLYVHDSSSTSWPTLQQLIDAGTPILLFQYNGEDCSSGNCPFGSGLSQEWFDYAVESEYDFATTDEVLTETGCTITRGTGTAFYGVNMFTQVPSEASCDILNTQVRSHVNQCITSANRFPTAVLVDCWDRGTVVQDVQEINKFIGDNFVGQQ